MLTRECDMLSYLKSFFPHLLEKILNFLDAKSLANAELVCREWRNSIAEGKCWKKHLLTQSLKSRQYLNQLLHFSEENVHLNLADTDNKENWLKAYHLYQKLHSNWLQGSYTVHEIEKSSVVCLTMNSTYLITAVEKEGKFLVKMWARKSLHCEKVFSEGNHFIETIDCDENILVAGVFESVFRNERRSGFLACILVRDLTSGEMIHRIVEDLVPLFDFSRASNESAFKVRFGHGLLISHRPIREPENPQGEVMSRLEIRKMISSHEIERTGVIRMACIGPGVSVNLIFVGYDEKYIILHRDGPPIFEIISTSTLELVRSIDAFDNCRSSHYNDGLLATLSTQMGSHTRTKCVIRLWDADTGICLREIQEPENTNYHNRGHKIRDLTSALCALSSFTNNYLVTFPDLPKLSQAKRIMKIRNLHAALDPSTSVDSISLQVCTLDWEYFSEGNILLDDFQLFCCYLEDSDEHRLNRLCVLHFLPQ